MEKPARFGTSNFDEIHFPALINKGRNIFVRFENNLIEK